MKKRVLSWLLVVAMVFTMAPAFSFAAFAQTGATVYVNSEAANDSAEYANGAIYKTLVGALKKAVSGDTIMLQTDAQLTAGITVKAGMELTLDLNGFRLDLNGYGITNKGSLTVTDTNEAKPTHNFEVSANGL